MPNLTTPIPPRLTGNPSVDVDILKKWGTALIDELTYLFNNLDSGNVIEAASVKAENIETANAKISNAQIGALTADKLVTGCVDTSRVNVSDNSGNLTISGSEIVISDKNKKRFIAAYDKATNKFRFELYNENGAPTVSINSDGDAVFSGLLESARIFSSTIIGTNGEAYESFSGGVFANIDPTGIKVMQDSGGQRKQKIGMSVGDDGTAYMVLGAGDGSGKVSINGVVCTNGSFKVEKNDGLATMGIVGSKPIISFWQSSGELWLNGERVMINGMNVQEEINSLKQQIAAAMQGN